MKVFRKIVSCVTSFFIVICIEASESFIPDPPSLDASNYILIDSTTNRVLAEKGSDENIEPASLTKIMTDYVVSDQITKGFISLDDQVFISEKCWRKKGSRMFITEGSTVVLSDLIKGMVIQSGNDASCAIAEHVAGTEENFAKLMMKYAERLGLSNTNFINATGWPNEEHYSSARDLAVVSKSLIRDFPDHYRIYKEKAFTYNDIRQRNRNSLLWQDDSIDGLKTGHTETAGYCLVSSGVRNETRLIAVTINSSSEKNRLTDNRRLLDYGFRYFRTKKLVSKGQNIKDEEVWGGQKDSVVIVPTEDLYLTLPLRDFRKVESIVVLDEYIQAPVLKDQDIGKMIFKLDNEEIGSVNLASSEDIRSKGLFGKAWSSIQLLVYKFLREEE